MDRTRVSERPERAPGDPRRAAADAPSGFRERTGRSSPRRDGAGRWRELARAVSWHRRLLAAALAAVAVLAVLDVLRPAAALGTPVVVAARDLPAGTALAAADLRVALERPGTAPAGSASSALLLTGAVLAAPVRSGEAVTDVRVASGALLATYRASVGPDVAEAALRVSDPGSLAMVAPGATVDVIAATTAGAGAGGPAVTLAIDVPVLAVPGGSAAGSGAPTGGVIGSTGASAAGGPAAEQAGGLVILAVTPATARLLARAAVTSQLSVLVHPR